MSQLKALIFDIDGTLAETEPYGHRIAFNRAFATAGLPWNWSIADYGKLLAVAGGKERIRAYIEQCYPELLALPNLTQQIADLHAAKTTYFKQLLHEEGIPPRLGVLRLLHSAKVYGLRLAIATTSAPDNAIALLKTALAPDSPDWFDVIAAGDIVVAKKPAPDIYQYVLHNLQLAADCCLVFEDSEQGLTAATYAGLKTVITVNPYTQAQDFSKAALVLNHLGEPTHPFEAIAGEVGHATYFDVNLAHQILGHP